MIDPKNFHKKRLKLKLTYARKKAKARRDDAPWLFLCRRLLVAFASLLHHLARESIAFVVGVFHDVDALLQFVHL